MVGNKRERRTGLLLTYLDVISVDLAGIFAVQCFMPLLLTVLADGRWLGRTVGCTMSLLLTESASTSELTGNSLVWALSLVVSGICQSISFEIG